MTDVVSTTPFSSPAVSRTLGLLVVAGLVLACSGPEPTPGSQPHAPRLVLLIGSCTVNTRYLSPYREGITFTPRLEAIANEGMVFERHITEAGQSGVAFASILSGAQADVHRVYRNAERLPGSLILLSETFSRAGFEPFYFAGHPMAGPDLGYGQGIPESNVIVSPHEPPWDAGLRGDTPEFLALLDRLARDPGTRAFVSTSFTVTHGPYALDALSDFLVRYPDQANGLSETEIRRLWRVFFDHHFELQWNFAEAVAALPEDLSRLVAAVEVVYRSRIHFQDRKLGAIVDAIRERGLLDETLLVFTADHGEMLYRDNALFKWEHGQLLAPEVLEVPLIMWGPEVGVRAGRYAGVTRSIDLYPTVTGLSGVAIPGEADVRGVDLSAVVRDADIEPPALLGFSHTTIADHRRQLGGWKHLLDYYPRPDVELMWVSVREEERVFKRVRSPQNEWSTQVFDLSRDPEERIDLFDASREDHARMAALLESYKQALVDAYSGPYRSGEEDRVIPDEELERLRSMGYIP